MRKDRKAITHGSFVLMRHNDKYNATHTWGFAISCIILRNGVSLFTILLIPRATLSFTLQLPPVIIWFKFPRYGSPIFADNSWTSIVVVHLKEKEDPSDFSGHVIVEHLKTFRRSENYHGGT